MPDIPQPDDTGSAGTQTTGTQQETLPVSSGPVEGLPITEAVAGLAATKSRSMGGELAARLIDGSFKQVSYDLRETQRELRETRQRLGGVQEELSKCETKAAVLTERIRAHARGRHLKNLSITAGMALVGIGVEFYRNDLAKFSLIICGLGSLLMLFGWLSTGGEAEQ